MSEDVLLDVSLEEDAVLTDEAKQRILDKWYSKEDSEIPPSFDELVRVAWLQDGIDPRDKKAKLVQEFIAKKLDKKLISKNKSSEQIIILNPEQKKYIENNRKTMKAVEIAKIIFNNNSLTPLNKESRAVILYYNKLNEDDLGFEKPSYVDGEYKPPQKLSEAVSVIKKYIPFTNLDIKNLTSKQKQDLTALVSYLNTMRFISQCNAFEDNIDRSLFESEFIRCCYDKGDLSEEEVDQYIVYSSEVVISKNIQKSINKFQAELDTQFESEDGKRLSGAFVDMIGNMREEYNQSITRQQKLLTDLKGKRVERIQKQGKELASIVNLVQAWKDEEFRKKTILLAEKRKKLLEKNLDTFMDMDEFKARVFGISKQEVLNG